MTEEEIRRRNREYARRYRERNLETVRARDRERRRVMRQDPVAYSRHLSRVYEWRRTNRERYLAIKRASWRRRRRQRERHEIKSMIERITRPARPSTGKPLDW